MELRLIKSIEEIPNLRERHAIIIVSDGKIQLGDLPNYGDVEIVCRDKKAVRVKKKTETQL